MMFSQKRLYSLPILFAVLFALILPCDSVAAVPIIDSASAECISCHEKGAEGAVHASGIDHSVGLDYADITLTDRTLRPVDELDIRIRLIEGRISCLTCHIPYHEANHERLARERPKTHTVPPTRDPMLTIDNAGSRLCLQCHNK